MELLQIEVLLVLNAMLQALPAVAQFTLDLIRIQVGLHVFNVRFQIIDILPEMINLNLKVIDVFNVI